MNWIIPFIIVVTSATLTPLASKVATNTMNPVDVSLFEALAVLLTVLILMFFLKGPNIEFNNLNGYLWAIFAGVGWGIFTVQNWIELGIIIVGIILLMR